MCIKAFHSLCLPKSFSNSVATFQTCCVTFVFCLCLPVVLVVVFGICWAPFHTDRLVWSFITHWTDQKQQLFNYIHIISGVFFYLSSAANPILYNLMSTRFREVFKEVMCRRHFQKRSTRKYSPSSTRGTTRSTVSEHLTGGNGQPLSDMEEFEMDLEGETAEENEAPFL